MVLKAKSLKMDLFAGGGGCGWEDSWCYPQMHQHLLPLVQRDDSVLDLGAGIGRSAFPFALMGAQVTLVDRDYDALAEASGIYIQAGIEDRIVDCGLDIEKFLSQNRLRYKFVILSETLTHMPKSQGVKVFREALEHCSGYIFVSAPSTFSWVYECYREGGYDCPEPGTFLDMCGCSGVEKIEPFSFYQPGELESIVVGRGGHIICAESRKNHTENYAWIVVASI